MKKIYLLLTALFVGVVAMTYLYFSKLGIATNSNDLALNQITEQSALVFCFESDPSFYDILKGQNLLTDLVGSEKSKIFANLGRLVAKGKWSKGLDRAKINIGFIPHGDTINFIVNTQLAQEFNLDGFRDTALTINKSGSNYELLFKDSSKCFVSIKNKLLTISDSPTHLNSDTEVAINPFTKYISAHSRENKNVLANLHIDYGKANNLIKSIISTKINGELDVFNQQNSFATLGYNFGTEKILFNGYTEILSDSSYYHLFTKEKDQEISIDAILPVTTANYTFYGIDNYLDWSIQLDRYLRINKEFDQKEKEKEYIASNFRLDIDQILPKFFNKQAISFQLSTGEKFGAIALTNGDKMGQLLIDLSADYAPDIKIFKRPGLLNFYFGKAFKHFERPFYTIVDNYLVFSNNASSVQLFLDSYRSNRTLVETDNYKNFANQLSSSATLLFYVNASNSDGIFSRQLKKSYYRQYQSEEGFKAYNAFCYQLSADNNKFATNMLILKKIKDIPSDTTDTNPYVVSPN